MIKQTKKMKVETPMGVIESDSGNHLVDVASIVFIIACILIFKKLWKMI
tara:strand:- start:832 stop:978 length:147 start_codon:yes stop_codon:yes gene_type:complete